MANLTFLPKGTIIDLGKNEDLSYWAREMYLELQEDLDLTKDRDITNGKAIYAPNEPRRLGTSVYHVFRHNDVIVYMPNTPVTNEHFLVLLQQNDRNAMSLGNSEVGKPPASTEDDELPF